MYNFFSGYFYKDVFLSDRKEIREFYDFYLDWGEVVFVVLVGDGLFSRLKVWNYYFKSIIIYGFFSRYMVVRGSWKEGYRIILSY